jgi:hypothetical protein
VILAYKGDPKLAKFHEEIIVAYKGDPKDIRENFGELKLVDLADSIQQYTGDADADES